jgi:hypothetical protein
LGLFADCLVENGVVHHPSDDVKVVTVNNAMIMLLVMFLLPPEIAVFNTVILSEVLAFLALRSVSYEGVYWKAHGTSQSDFGWKVKAMIGRIVCRQGAHEWPVSPTDRCDNHLIDRTLESEETGTHLYLYQCMSAENGCVVCTHNAESAKAMRTTDKRAGAPLSVVDSYVATAVMLMLYPLAPRAMEHLQLLVGIAYASYGQDFHSWVLGRLEHYKTAMEYTRGLPLAGHVDPEWFVTTTGRLLKSVDVTQDADWRRPAQLYYNVATNLYGGGNLPGFSAISADGRAYNVADVVGGVCRTGKHRGMSFRDQDCMCDHNVGALPLVKNSVNREFVGVSKYTAQSGALMEVSPDYADEPQRSMSSKGFSDPVKAEVANGFRGTVVVTGVSPDGEEILMVARGWSGVNVMFLSALNYCVSGMCALLCQNTVERDEAVGSDDLSNTLVSTHVRERAGPNGTFWRPAVSRPVSTLFILLMLVALKANPGTAFVTTIEQGVGLPMVNHTIIETAIPASATWFAAVDSVLWAFNRVWDDYYHHTNYACMLRTLDIAKCNTAGDAAWWFLVALVVLHSDMPWTCYRRVLGWADRVTNFSSQSWMSRIVLLPYHVVVTCVCAVIGGYYDMALAEERLKRHAYGLLFPLMEFLVWTRPGVLMDKCSSTSHGPHAFVITRWVMCLLHYAWMLLPIEQAVVFHASWNIVAKFLPIILMVAGLVSSTTDVMLVPSFSDEHALGVIMLLFIAMGVAALAAIVVGKTIGEKKSASTAVAVVLFVITLLFFPPTLVEMQVDAPASCVNAASFSIQIDLDWSDITDSISSGLSEAVRNIEENVAPALQDGIDVVSAQASPVYEYLREAAAPSFDVVKQVVQDTTPVLKKHVDHGIDVVGDVLKGALPLLESSIDSARFHLAEGLERASETIRPNYPCLAREGHDTQRSSATEQ